MSTQIGEIGGHFCGRRRLLRELEQENATVEVGPFRRSFDVLTQRFEAATEHRAPAVPG